MKYCTVSGCEREYKGRGYCSTHYTTLYWRLHNDRKKYPPEYKAWENMKIRCYIKSHAHSSRYMGRGIKVSDKWVNDYEAFHKYVGDRPGKGYSLDRINNDGDYEPGNVRWATQKQQCNNMSTNVFYTFNGVTMIQAEWARTIGLSGETIHRRIQKGWSIEKTLTTPKRYAQ